MDPEECLNRIQHALNSGDLAEARDAIGDYREWRRKGGFEPAVGSGEERLMGGDSIARSLENQYHAARAVTLIREDEPPKLVLTSQIAAFLDDCVARDRQECLNLKPYKVPREKQDTCLQRMHQHARANQVPFYDWDHRKLCEVCETSWIVTMASIRLGELRRREEEIAAEARATVPAKHG